MHVWQQLALRALFCECSRFAPIWPCVTCFCHLPTPGDSYFKGLPLAPPRQDQGLQQGKDGGRGRHSPSLALPPAGGVVTSGLAIYDTMQYILNPICTWCVGQAASMGSLLLAAGTPGMRHSLPNSRIMIHQPSGGARVSARPCKLLQGPGMGSQQMDRRGGRPVGVSVY